MHSLYNIHNNVITGNSLGLGLRGSESSLIDEMAETFGPLEHREGLGRGFRSEWQESLNSDNVTSHTSSNISPLDPEEFRRQGHMIIDFLADYYRDVEKYPVLSQVEPGYLQKCLPKSTPHNPEPIETILQDLQEHIVPGFTHWQSPNFFAYFQCTSSIAGFLGEMPSTGFNVVGFSWIASPAATELETIVVDWLGEMLELPKSFLFSGNGGGVLQGTTCEAVLCTIVAARDQMLSQIGKENLIKWWFMLLTRHIVQSKKQHK
nr:tyrosine/dopa decarboxylase 3 [Quercus suber]